MVKLYRSRITTAVMSGCLIAGTVAINSGASAAVRPSFGTINGFDQKAEHARITRAALHCKDGTPDTDDRCLRPGTLDLYAGKEGDLGAVGAPDVPLKTGHDSHCDDADYLDTGNYPQSPERRIATLKECVDLMRRAFNSAVMEAGKLVNDQLEISEKETTLQGCIMVQKPSNAKCAALKRSGEAAHAYQDFFSHSNWSDTEDPGRPTGLDNPPGLRKREIPEFLDLEKNIDPTPANVPDQFTTGCFSLNEIFPFLPDGCERRIKHKDLNSDKGDIDPNTGDATSPRTPRGKIDDNFSQAVTWANITTQLNWFGLLEKIKETYPGERGIKISCAMSHDNPVTECADRKAAQH
ncbi:CinY protein [Streptomyces yunnanensis]|uniref:CinY protein n=1 Tax=Streptomyces yunnanensis TaxID=156453 RepID=A0A9X8R0L2_9ACTN|nr:CinY protein [Streptomyces yunnanensis]SHN35273.1 hypothetical protein SAMN05216268_1555 [Streptomyces yunnanensis]